jgi:hypothetical protein
MGRRDGSGPVISAAVPAKLKITIRGTPRAVWAPVHHRNAGMTSLAKRVSCSIMRSRGVPSAHAIITCSRPG